MINDDFNFNHGNSDFPLSIEEFAAYMDGNLSDDEMCRMSSVIENDESMQDVMDGMEQAEVTLAGYVPEDRQLPPALETYAFDIPKIEKPASERGGLGRISSVAACAAALVPPVAACMAMPFMLGNMLMDKFAPEPCDAMCDEGVPQDDGTDGLLDPGQDGTPEVDGDNLSTE